MYIYLHSNRLIGEVQNDFHHLFPFLKLVFYRKLSVDTNPVPRENILGHMNKMREAGLSDHVAATFHFAENTTVHQLEESLAQRFGLIAQVFRKSGAIWLETTGTDSWTLEHQNEHGRESSSVKNPESLADYDLTRDAED